MSEVLDRAEVALEARDIASAEAAFRLAVEAGLEPDRTDAGLWMCAMLRGDFAAAWQANDRIRGRGAADPNRLWQGEPIAGKRVIVRCLRGFGDAVQFLRYLPTLRAAARRVTVEVAPRLVELVRCLGGADEVITWGPGAPAHAPPWDVQMELMELPYIFRTAARDLPICERYLRLPPGPPLPPAAGLRVGVAWTVSEWDPARALPVEYLRALLAERGCEFWSLASTQPPEPILEAPGTRADLVRLAQLIAQMDVVVTVDSLAAHLAGALGVPAFVMLQHAADWRWQDRRQDSPWYPSLRLFRQPTPGDWASVVAEVQHALQQRRA